jgi:DNA-binding LytR/AlgR family response regulator
MRAIEEMVKPFQFVRTHKSYIVALQHIDSIEAGKIMISGHQIPVSESYRDLLTQFIEGNAYIA